MLMRLHFGRLGSQLQYHSCRGGVQSTGSEIRESVEDLVWLAPVVGQCFGYEPKYWSGGPG
jgi:hypothetical protein